MMLRRRVDLLLAIFILLALLAALPLCAIRLIPNSAGDTAIVTSEFTPASSIDRARVYVAPDLAPMRRRSAR